MRLQLISRLSHPILFIRIKSLFLTLGISFILVVNANTQEIDVNGYLIHPDWDQDQINLALAPLLQELDSRRVVHLEGDAPEGQEENFLKVQRKIIHLLYNRAGFELLVMPVGIFEGWWADQQLNGIEEITEVPATFYRVWRESPAFLDLIRFVHDTKSLSHPMILVGGLCRYHAAGKSIYGDSLVTLYSNYLDDSLLQRIEKYLAGPSRLSRSTKEHRIEAMKAVEETQDWSNSNLSMLEKEYGIERMKWEHHFLKNLTTFVHLEQLRAGDLPEDSEFGKFEKKQNLDWLMQQAFLPKKMIYWEGRGSGSYADSLPIAADHVYTIRMSGH